jgi:hypothetical protein
VCDHDACADPYTEADYERARQVVTEHDADDGTVEVHVGSLRVVQGLSYGEAEELASFLRQEVAAAIRQAVAADRIERANGAAR